MDIRTRQMVMLRAVLANCGFLHLDSGAYYFNERQALAICHFSTSRRAAAAERRVVETFRQFHAETLPRRDIVQALRHLKPFAGNFSAGRDGMVIDALRSKLRQTVRTRRLTTRRKRSPVSGRAD
ncbi:MULTISPECIES: hypothetical protein [Rhizobium]|uniref:hypothetical protein n=1 Tax=Rhizobium phaseoli TaxID=396 RepID=UPI0001907835|nr:hypothetical protein [Rhizobium phaseoli]